MKSNVDKWRLGKAKEKVDKFYKNTDCKAYGDWRDRSKECFQVGVSNL